jgi:hypothetical protein
LPGQTHGLRTLGRSEQRTDSCAATGGVGMNRGWLL